MYFQLHILIVFTSISSSLQAYSKPYYSLANAEDLFDHFIVAYDREYEDDTEKQNRFEIFKRNLEDINKKNIDHEHGVYKVTKFSDLTKEEYIRFTAGDSNIIKAATYHMCKTIDMTDDDTYDDSPPDSFDWRDKNVVTAVKNQEKCGSCWAFSAVGNIESQIAIKHGYLLDLSEQFLIDCDDLDSGCCGGLQERAFSFLIEFGGIALEGEYTYRKDMKKPLYIGDQCLRNGKQECNIHEVRWVPVVEDCLKYQVTSEDQLKNLLVNEGPLSVIMNADDIQNSGEGIVTCPADGHHAVLLIGYHTDTDVPYWIIKNSWGTNEGHQGFFHIAMGGSNCGLFENVSRAIIT